MSSAPNILPTNGETQALSWRFQGQTISRAEGLPSGQVHAIAQDQQKLLLFAGPSGLSIYDGFHVQKLDKRSGLSTQGLREIAVDAENNVWIGSDMGVDVRDAAGNCEPLLTTQRWELGFVECLLPLSAHTMLIGTARGLLRWRYQQIPQDGTGLKISEGRVTAMVLDAQQRAWVASSETGLCRLGRESLRACQADVFSSIGNIECLAAAGNDGILVGGQHGLALVDLAGKHIKRIVDTPGNSSVNCVALYGGRLWLGIGTQLRCYQFNGNNEPSYLGFAEAGSPLNALFVDDVGNIWAATDSKGILKISALHSAISLPMLPNNAAVFSLCTDGPDGLLLGGNRNSWRLQLSQSRISRLTPLDDLATWDLLPIDPHHIYAATNSGIKLVSQNEPKPLPWLDHLHLVSPGRVLAHWKDCLWIGTVTGLARVDASGKIDSPVCTLGQGPGYVYTLCVNQNALWIGTLGRGLWRIVENRLERAHPDFDENANIYAIAVSASQANTAIIEDNKIWLLDGAGNRALLAQTEDAVAGWAVVWEGERKLWVGGSTGLRAYDIDSGTLVMQLQAILNPNQWEFTTSRSLCWIDKQRLACGVNGGLVLVDVAALAENIPAPTVRLAQKNWLHALVSTESETQIVEPGKWTLHMRVCCTWYLDERNLKVRFRAVGFDNEWSLASSSGQISYTSLPPGNYIIEAQAHSPLTGWGPVSTLINFQVKSPWWTRGWLPALLTISDAVVGLVHSRLRNQALMQANQQLDARVRQRTIELESANEALRSVNIELEHLSLTDALTGLPNRRSTMSTLEAEIKRAQRSETVLSILLVDIDYFKLFNDSLGHQQGDACLKQVAEVMRESLRAGTDYIGRHGGEEFLVILPDTDVIGARIAAEKLRNAVQNQAIPHRRSEVADVVTISAGIACSDLLDTESNTAAAMLAAADEALYLAKSAGRNCWRFSL